MSRSRILAGTGIGLTLLIVAFVLFSGSRSENAQKELELTAQQPSSVSPVHTAKDIPPTVMESPIRFELMTPRSGIDMVYYGSPSPEKYMTEQNGGGVALSDFDNDGWLDVFLVNGSHFQKPARKGFESNRLYRSRPEPFQYRDVTVDSRLESAGFGMGCTAADYNNDGFTDLFVACYGQSQLWCNNGDGTFEEVSGQVGLTEEAWSCSAAFADVDSDGDLDLYVVNYVEWNSDDPPCFYPIAPPIKISCSPMSHTGQVDYLYCNQGKGTFEEIGEAAGITTTPHGKGLGVVICDFDSDERLDVYVANDTTPNNLFRNLGDLKFRDVAAAEGVAISQEGTIGAGMGTAAGDYNQDGHFDIFVTNFKDQCHDAFANLGGGGFIATNWRIGLDSLTRSKLSFGIVLADFDLDQFPDLFIANGHVWDITSGDPTFEYAMQPSLYRNEAGSKFGDVSLNSGDYFRKSWVGRAAASGDLDNDGATDLVVTHLQEPPAILRNESSRQGNSATLRLVGRQAARQPLGIRVDVTIGDRQFATQVPAGGSFQASHDQRILVATGTAGTLSRVTVHWSPDMTETWTDLPVGTESVLIQGRGPNGAMISETMSLATDNRR
jgi:hypothetical protein